MDLPINPWKEATEAEEHSYKEKYEALRKVVDNVIDNLDIYVNRIDSFIPSHSQFVFISRETYMRLKEAVK